ncbi:MAG: hypothetical protein K2J08_12765 [Ruminococcus sp.]|nr:hypothetical protein [Ruminococcus sp.]
MKRFIKWVKDFTELVKALNELIPHLEALTIKLVSWVGWIIILIYILNQN